MPPRTKGQPKDMIDRYRTRLNEEMRTNGETDRSLEAKLTEMGCPITHTGIYKTRAGTRQPSVDECYAVARIFGYPDLSTFLKGPEPSRIPRAAARLGEVFDQAVRELRGEYHEAFRDLYHATRNPDYVAALDQENPNWRDDLRARIEVHIRFAIKDQTLMLGMVEDQLKEVFEIP